MHIYTVLFPDCSFCVTVPHSLLQVIGVCCYRATLFKFGFTNIIGAPETASSKGSYFFHFLLKWLVQKLSIEKRIMRSNIPKFLPVMPAYIQHHGTMILKICVFSLRFFAQILPVFHLLFVINSSYSVNCK